MTRIFYLLSFFIIIISCDKKSEKIITCGSNKILILEAFSKEEKPTVIWSWEPSNAKSLPQDYILKYFNKIDECKPINNGEKIMITSSTGGVAIINKKTKDVDFYSVLGNPHTIEKLPNNIVAVAGSNHKNGNCIALYKDTTKGNLPISKDSLFGGHGLYWDSKREILYALGQNELKTYRYSYKNKPIPKIEETNSWKLLDIGGHDLVNYDSENLLITTNNNVWLFHKEKEKFTVFEPLANTKSIKGINWNQKNKRLTYIKAEEKWWSHQISFTNPNTKIEIPNVNLYKVRWWNY